MRRKCKRKCKRRCKRKRSQVERKCKEGKIRKRSFSKMADEADVFTMHLHLRLRCPGSHVWNANAAEMQAQRNNEGSFQVFFLVFAWHRTCESGFNFGSEELWHFKSSRMLLFILIVNFNLGSLWYNSLIRIDNRPVYYPEW